MAYDVALELGAKVRGAELGTIDLGAERKYLYTHFPFFPEVPSILSPSSRLVSQLPLAKSSESRNWALETPIGTAYLQEQSIIYPLLYFHASIWYTIDALLKSLFVIWRTTL